MAQAKSAEEAATAVERAVVSKVSDTFVLQENEIDPAFHLCGFIGALELRNWLVLAASIEMSIFDSPGSPSLTELAKSMVSRRKSILTAIN
jgi:hypothetical protein